MSSSMRLAQHHHHHHQKQYTLKCTDLPQFDALLAQADLFRADDKLHLRNLCNDSARCAGMSTVYTSRRGQCQIILDYSRQRVTGETMELLFDLADAVGLTDRREALRRGERVNVTENKPVLHHLLRMPLREPDLEHSYMVTDILDGPAHIRQIMDVNAKVRDFVHQVRTGIYRSVTDKPFRNVLVIGIGGFKIGADFVLDALQADESAAEAAKGRSLRFVSNIDPVAFTLATADWDPGETLVILLSRQFIASETTLNARTARHWMVSKLSSPEIPAKLILSRHFVAVNSVNVPRSKKFGIDIDKIFTIGEWINPRFSLCSAAGVLPLSLHYSYEVMEELLAGAHDMDQHFFNAPLRDNIPVVLGLLGVWNSTFLGYNCRALLPYSQSLRKLPRFVQHVDMESNGKRVALDGSPLLHRSGEIDFGECGTDGQHRFYQLLHQGRVVPADFIGFMESQRPIDLDGEPVSHHDELMSNFFAQPDALAYGKTSVDLSQEQTPEPLREHMVFTGNRPSSSLLLTRLNAFSLGQLIALFEHRTTVQGFVWGINSFDQYGIELGRVLAKHVRSQISASRKTGASVQGFNSSTSSLLEYYLAHGKET
jgi:glucose-6-phosphate isomerase